MHTQETIIIHRDVGENRADPIGMYIILFVFTLNILNFIHKNYACDLINIDIWK